MKNRSWKALLLTLTLVLGFALPAQAAGVRLSWDKKGNTVSLTLRGLGEESVYGVQLELTVKGNHTKATFVPAAEDVYSPECRVSASSESSRIVLYLTSQEPLNSGGILEVGKLTLEKEFTMPADVTVTLLGHELKRLPQADGAVISASGQNQGGGNGGDENQGEEDGGEDRETEEYQIRISSSAHGKVTTRYNWAEPRSGVMLTVAPENDYSLKELKVTAPGGREMSLTDVGGNRYTFRMPTADVEVTASFQWTGLTHTPMSFSDVAEDHWYHDAVHYVFERGMMTGTSVTTFSPDMVASRGMIVTILHRLEGSPKAESANFSDVPRSEYYAPAVDWALSAGIASGYGGNETGTFGPENSITREQLATILYRYGEKTGADMAPRGDLSGFSDGGDISDYAKEPMAWAVGVGLVSGMGDGTIAPAGNATRAQVATILTRYCQNITP